MPPGISREIDVELVDNEVLTAPDHTEPDQNTASPGDVTREASPLSWLPAKDALPTELSPEVDLQIAQNTFVYSRRPRTQGTNPLAVQFEAHHQPATPQPAVQTQDQDQQLPSTTSFLDKITKPVQTVLAVPKPWRRPARRAVTTDPPRRSRRIAKLPADVMDHKAATTVCRCLGFTESENQVPPEALQKYTEFFKKPLIRRHVEALAKLVGKEMPTKEQLRAVEAQGTRGGILVAWNDSLNATARRIHDHSVSVQFDSDNHSWWFMGVYGPHQDDKWIMGYSVSDLAPLVYAAVPPKTRHQRTVAQGMFDKSWPTDIQGDWWRKAVKRVPKKNKKGLNSTIIMVAWVLWKHRNACVFDGVQANMTELLRVFNEERHLWCMAGARGLRALGQDQPAKVVVPD
ncbi:hypothetical protein PR202_gb29485 [Eleusine coracana subsp. coracana]|uniref:Uncharacterized protein n=1 Tax=Eleusine coracana subsp. coracana TaxID=191504 RepID=A0AAV5G0A3_ELECO|nr:hypothetical protein PR202_gb29485 [Eleusine coracana subsp. coracana]